MICGARTDVRDEIGVEFDALDDGDRRCRCTRRRQGRRFGSVRCIGAQALLPVVACAGERIGGVVLAVDLGDLRHRRARRCGHGVTLGDRGVVGGDPDHHVHRGVAVERDVVAPAVPERAVRAQTQQIRFEQRIGVDVDVARPVVVDPFESPRTRLVVVGEVDEPEPDVPATIDDDARFAVLVVDDTQQARFCFVRGQLHRPVHHLGVDVVEELGEGRDRHRGVGVELLREEDAALRRGQRERSALRVGRRVLPVCGMPACEMSRAHLGAHCASS